MPDPDRSHTHALPILDPATSDSVYQRSQSGVSRFNLGVFGPTGVGKSTLINTVFGEDLAETGVGKPVTQGSRLYRHDSSLIGILDNKGLEIGDSSDALLRDLEELITRNREGDRADLIHVVWYCIRANSRRIQPEEQAFVRKIAGLGIPILLVITQTHRTPDGQIFPDSLELGRVIAKLDLPISGDIIYVNAQEDDFAGQPAHGMEQLLNRTSQIAPRGVRVALASAQCVSLSQKSREALRLIREYESSSAEIDVRDFPEHWLEMVAGLSRIFGVSEEQTKLALDNTQLVLDMRKVSGRRRPARTGRRPAGLVSQILMLVAERDPAEPDRKRKSRLRKHEPSESVVRGVVQAIGMSWTATCRHYWAQALPAEPEFEDPAGMGHWLDGELQERLDAVGVSADLWG